MPSTVESFREIQPGINWVHYVSNTREDALKWFEELTGHPANYDWIVQETRDGRHSFRLHR